MAPLLVTSGGQDWKSVQICSLEDIPECIYLMARMEEKRAVLVLLGGFLVIQRFQCDMTAIRKDETPAVSQAESVNVELPTYHPCVQATELLTCHPCVQATELLPTCHPCVQATELLPTCHPCVRTLELPTYHPCVPATELPTCYP